MQDNFIVVDNKKYMWDGQTYESEIDAKKTADEYRKENFEIQITKREGKYFVYSRREAEAVVQGQS